MRTTIAAASILLLAGAVLAQERLPTEDVQRFGKKLVELSANLDAPAQVKVEPNADKALAIRAKQVAALVMPDTNLSADALSKAGKDVVPVGQLWMRRLVTAVDGKATPRDKLRILRVPVKDEEEPLPLFLLGVRKKGDGLELLVYGLDKEALLTLPLTKTDARQELPIELDGIKNDNDTGTLTINLLGKYEAKLMVVKMEN
jgi:hypothetical protein